ncbi:somatostatin [Motacilla alba alba]|nr:somatostatin [Motacilla alba alba]
MELLKASSSLLFQVWRIRSFSRLPIHHHLHSKQCHLTGRLEEWGRVSQNPSGTGACQGTSMSSDPEMEKRVPQAEPGTSTPRARHRSVIASRSGRATAGAGALSPEAPAAPGAARGREPGNGPVPERPTGAGEAKGPPRAPQHPHPLQEPEAIALRGPFAAPRILKPCLTDGAGPGSRARGFGRAAAGGLHPRALGQSRGWAVTAGTPHRRSGGLQAGKEGADGPSRELWKGGDLGTGTGGGQRGGELRGNRGGLAGAGQSGASPGPFPPPSQRPTPGGVGRGGRPRLDVRRRVYKGGGRRGDPQRRSRAAAEPPAPPAAASRARPAGEMLSCRLQCALALLSIALALGTVSAAPSDPRLRQFLQKSLAAAAGKQELAKYFLAELLSEPSQTENEALESEDLSRGAEQDEVRLELERSANSNPALAPRERKAGCKNFFWKTFTSC